MPKIIEGLTLSDSLYKLIIDNSKKTKCCALLAIVLERVQGGQSAKGDCPCPECKRARKGQKWINEKRIGDFFAFREKPGMISYMPKGKTQTINDEGQWERKGRVEIKPAKWIKSMLHPRLAKRLKDHAFAAFDTVLKAEEEAQKITFKFVPFSDAYDSGNYSDQTRPESCMWGRDVGPFYRLLGAKALIAMNGKGIYVGRAVFWPNVKTEKGEVIQLLDRIYAKIEIMALFKAYAKEQGWHYKYKQNRSTLKEVVDPVKEDVHSWVMTVESSKPFSPSMFFPYMDTFQGGRDKESITNIRHEQDQSYIYSYVSTNGVREEFEDHTGEIQTVDGAWIPEGESCYVEGYGTYAQTDERIKKCHHSGYWWLKKECVYIKHEDFWVYKDFAEEYLTPEEKKAKAKAEKARMAAQKVESMKMMERLFTPTRGEAYTTRVQWTPISIPEPSQFNFNMDVGTVVTTTGANATEEDNF